MSKFKKVKEIKNEISIEMVKACKNDIAKFGFDAKEYIKFLISIGAMKDKDTVLKFRDDEMEQYRELFLKKNERSTEDTMQLDKYKIESSYYEGDIVVKFFTGYFCPRSFWDMIYNHKLE